MHRQFWENKHTFKYPFYDVKNYHQTHFDGWSHQNQEVSKDVFRLCISVHGFINIILMMLEIVYLKNNFQINV